MTPLAFAARFAFLANGVAQAGPALARRAALAATTAVITATPVDKGRARSNWLASINAPAREEVPSLGTDPGPPIERARDVIEEFGPGDSEIWLSNNLPYIKRLNEGWSAQAPAGFVEAGVQAAVQSIRGARVVPL